MMCNCDLCIERNQGRLEAYKQRRMSTWAPEVSNWRRKKAEGVSARRWKEDNKHVPIDIPALEEELQAEYVSQGGGI